MVLSLAMRAPSIDDSQPWLWRVDAEGLHLYASPHSDADSRDVVLSCGAALHHCIVALAALGWRTTVQRFPDASEPRHLATLNLYRHPAGAVDVVLAAAIPRRRSDWRPYNSWPVFAPDMALIGARADHAGVTARQVEGVPGVRHVVAQAVWRHAADHDHLGESAARSVLQSADGPQWNVPPWGAQPFADSAIGRAPAAESGNENAVIVALGTQDDGPSASLRAGEATSVVLLSATALGLASCIVAEPLATEESRDALQTMLIGTVGIPKLLLRIGWPPVGADPLPASPRRPLTDVCEWMIPPSMNGLTALA
jgi:nitroreductase